MEQQIEFFTQKLNKLRLKEVSFSASGYKTPQWLLRDIRITELALDRITKNHTK